MIDPNDFITPPDESVSGWIMQRAMDTAIEFKDETDTEKNLSLISAVIAWIETELPKRKCDECKDN